MHQVLLNNILEATFRANPNYGLIQFDRLPPQEQQVLHSLQKDREFYGLLCPRDGTGLGVKAVCRDTALLYFTLKEPGRLPAYIKDIFGDQCNQAIAELVLDGVLEIDSDGTFLSGAQAFRLVHVGNPLPNKHQPIANKSIEALKYAQALDISDSRKISVRLYAYGRQPVTPYWKKRFPTPDAVAQYLGLHAGDNIKSKLERNWLRVPTSQPNDTWLRWNSRYERKAQPKTKLTYKLYVSPAFEYVPDAFQTFVTALPKLKASSFKVGGDLDGLLRPDKIIAYFRSFVELHEAVNHLAHKLNGCPAHGVPFTQEIAGDGLLSWGIDPPNDEPILEWQGPESWRLWVTNRLAIALLAAKSTPSTGVEPWQFALDRLRLEGVDTHTWAPSPMIWHETLT